MLPSIVILTLSLATDDLLTSPPIAPSAMKMLFTGVSTPFGYSLQCLLPFDHWLICYILLEHDWLPSTIWHKGNSLYMLYPFILSIKLIVFFRKKMQYTSGAMEGIWHGIRSSANLNPTTIWIINVWEAQFANLFAIKTSHCFHHSLFCRS